MENLIVTNAGQSLIAKLISGTAEINFTKIKTSDYVYTASDIPALTELSQIKQTANVSSISIVSSSIVKVRALVNNTGLNTGYYVKAVGLYATDSSTNTEILFGVSLCGELADYIPAQSDTVTGITYTFNCKVDNTEQVTVTVDPSGVASAEDLEDLEGIITNNINSLLSRVTSLENDLKEHIQMGGFKKYKEAGTYTFKVPVGISQILVSAIGGGGGGASGGKGYTLATSNNFTSAGGGGGGGYGDYIIDNSVSVTAGETLTVIIGDAGIGGAKALASHFDMADGAKGNNGVNGGDTILKRGDTILKSVSGGTGGISGNGGGYATTYKAGVGGTGGTTGGGDGVNGVKTGEFYNCGGDGGSGGTIENFGIYGNGGKGGKGATGGDENEYSEAGTTGTNGAILICYGGINFEDVKW